MPGKLCTHVVENHTMGELTRKVEITLKMQLSAKLVCNEETAMEERLKTASTTTCVCCAISACASLAGRPLVVEIQHSSFNPKAIYDIKSDEGHAAYVRARNLLGE